MAGREVGTTDGATLYMVLTLWAAEGWKVLETIR